MQGIYCLYAAIKRKAKKAESRSSSSRVEHYYINEDCRGPVAVWFVCTRHMWGNAVQKQGRRELGGGPGQNFFRKKVFGQQPPLPPPRRQLFREKNFPDEYVVIAFQRLYLNFSSNFRYFSQKNKYLALCAEIFHPKNDWGTTNIF